MHLNKGKSFADVETNCWVHAALFQCVPGASSLGLKWPGSEAGVKNERKYISSFLVCHIRGRHMDNLTIIVYQIVVHEQLARIPTALYLYGRKTGCQHLLDGC